MNFSKLFLLLPHFLQEIAISFYNTKLYKKRHGKSYFHYKKWYKEHEFLPKEAIEDLQLERLKNFVQNTLEKSTYYQQKYSAKTPIEINTIEDLRKLPILKKEEIRKHIDNIITAPKEESKLSKTGGTTGISMKVYYGYKNMQERFAFLDSFRERFGYQFGEKTAWFSGKEIINSRDVGKNRYWKLDHFNKIKFYSTFHINPKTIPFYIENLKKFKPMFIVGFPSSLFEIAQFGINRNLDLGGHKVKAIFPTAETLVDYEIEKIKAFFGGGIYDQYASSEGAPFITECEAGNKHFESLSGVIEVVSDDGVPATKGRMLVTAFATEVTPLIRYDIGDTMEWDTELKSCPCGRNTPIVKALQGRINDFIYSPENGKVNLGNISNCLKTVSGVDRFQVEQSFLDKITVKAVIDKSIYTKKDEENFETELRARVGTKMKIDFVYLPTIAKEKSGKHRLVINNIKSQLENISF